MLVTIFFSFKQFRSLLRRLLMHWEWKKEGSEWVTVLGFIADLLPGYFSGKESSKSDPRTGQITWWVYSGHKPLSFWMQSENCLTCLRLFSYYCTSCFSNWPANEFPMLILFLAGVWERQCGLLLPKLIPALILHQEEHWSLNHFGKTVTPELVFFTTGHRTNGFQTNARRWKERLGSFIW